MAREFVTCYEVSNQGIWLKNLGRLWIVPETFLVDLKSIILISKQRHLPRQNIKKYYIEKWQHTPITFLRLNSKAKYLFIKNKKIIITKIKYENNCINREKELR